MNKLITLLFLSIITLNVAAQSNKFVNRDGSAHSEICIAAATSTQELDNKMKKLNYTKADLKSFTCNGLSLNKFAKKYSSETYKAVNVYTFNSTTNSIDADICIAAATSNEAYLKLKTSLKSKKFLKGLTCNNMPLGKFAKKYGNNDFNI